MPHIFSIKAPDGQERENKARTVFGKIVGRYLEMIKDTSIHKLQSLNISPTEEMSHYSKQHMTKDKEMVLKEARDQIFFQCNNRLTSI